MKLRQLPIHRSLTRPILFAGGERKLVMINFILIVTLLFGAGFNRLTIICAAFLATIGHITLIKLAHYDPQLSLIYQRLRRYHEWYPALASVTSKHHPVLPAIVRGARP